MTYLQRINSELRPGPPQGPQVVDLFAGCGGLSLGFEAAGFEVHGYEMDERHCETHNANLSGHCEQTTLTVDSELPAAQVIVGGPPCQPFSVGGGQRGLKDSRDGFPIFISAVSRLKPRVFMFENVRGLLYRNRWYFDEIVNALEGLGYIVEFKLMNAVEFGVPQRRERVIAVGHRGGYVFPDPEPRRVTAGHALGRLPRTAPSESKFLTPSMDRYVAKYEKASKCVNPRDLRLDQPSRTLTCRNLAGATGDMMRIVLPDGRRRRLLPREAARLQSFPDWFRFRGREASTFTQIGNAVPPLFAMHLARSIRRYLDEGGGAGKKRGRRAMPKQESFVDD